MANIVMTTNELIAHIAEELTELIGWAEADVQLSLDNNAKEQARDDKARQATYIYARRLLLNGIK